MSKTFKIQDREAGNLISGGFTSYEDAAETLKDFETEDMAEGTYTPDFYEIVEEEQQCGAFKAVEAELLSPNGIKIGW
jgi:hypothetical protein